MSNHPPPVNHRRSSLPKPSHAAASSSRRYLTPLLLLFLLLLRPAAAQNDTAPGQPEHSPDNPYPYGQRFNPSLAVIMVVLVSAFFVMGFVSVYIRQCAESRFRGGPRDDSEGTFLFGRGSIRRAARGIDASVVEGFPTFQYSSVKGLKIGKGSLECAVCLNEFEDDDVLRLLPRCNHAFHTQCIDAWLSSHDTCPVCRANLAPKPGEKFDPPILHMPEPQPGSEITGQPDHVCIHVDDGQNINSESLSWQTEDCSSINKSRPPLPPRSRSTGMRFTRLFPFPRSHSTGHSLVQPGEDHEKFTLRLPEDVRDQIIKSASLNRARSCAADLPRARSERTGYRRSGSIGGRSTRGRNCVNYERFDQEDRTGQWGFSMTPPFIGRTGSVRAPGGPGGDDVGMPPPRNMSRSEKLPPFDRVFIGLDGDEGVRSSDRLRPPHG